MRNTLEAYEYNNNEDFCFGGIYQMFYGFNNNMYYSIWDNYWRVNRINSEAAIQIALQRVPDRVVKVELDYENGRLVYEVDIRNQSGLYEVHVDAITGRILKVEREDNWD